MTTEATEPQDGRWFAAYRGRRRQKKNRYSRCNADASRRVPRSSSTSPEEMRDQSARSPGAAPFRRALVPRAANAVFTLARCQYVSSDRRARGQQPKGLGDQALLTAGRLRPVLRGGILEMDGPEHASAARHPSLYRLPRVERWSCRSSARCIARLHREIGRSVASVRRRAVQNIVPAAVTDSGVLGIPIEVDHHQQAGARTPDLPPRRTHPDARASPPCRELGIDRAVAQHGVRDPGPARVPDSSAH